VAQKELYTNKHSKGVEIYCYEFQLLVHFLMKLE